MTLKPILTLTPQQPTFSKVGEYDDSQPQVTAFVNFWNIAALAWGGSGGTIPNLETQLNEDWIYMSGSSAAPFDEDIDGFIQNRERSQIIEIGIQGIKVNELRKVLLVIELQALGEHAVARFALSRKIVRTDHLRLGDNSLSVLVDIPYDRAWIYIDIKHVQTLGGKASAFAFKKVTGYLF